MSEIIREEKFDIRNLIALFKRGREVLDQRRRDAEIASKILCKEVIRK